jgi:hypothetical protein
VRVAFPIVIAVVLAVYALIDSVQTDRARVRGFKRPVWWAVIVVLPVVGPVLWLTLGKIRPRRHPDRPVPPPPVAPDDDPEFLRQLRNLDAEHEQMLKDWESDLKRREDEMRRRGEGEDDPRG